MSSDLITLCHDERLDQSEVLRLEFPARSAKAYLLAPDHELEWRDRRFYVGEQEDNRDGSQTTISIEAEACWYRLGDLTYVGSFLLANIALAEGLDAILAGTGWSRGLQTDAASLDPFTMEAQDKSRLELLRIWSKITGRFIVWNHVDQQVDLVDTRGADLGLGFRYRRNLRRVRRRRRPPLVTVLYPYGADDLTIAGVNGGFPYLEDFTYYTDQGLTLPEARARFTRSKVWADRSFLVDTDLLAAAQAKLTDWAQTPTTYELDVVDLSELTHMAELLHVGDTVRVNDPDFAADLRTTIVRYERYPKEPWRNRVELSAMPVLIPDPNASVGRPSSSIEWNQFTGPIRGDYQIRNDGDYIVARIPLRFREGGLAHYGVDVRAVGVGDGVLHVEVFDAVNAVIPFRSLDVPYLDGEEAQAVITWGGFDLEGAYDYRVRVTTVAAGGPDPALGVNITADPDGAATFWIMAHGAVQETPTAPNSQRFEYNGDKGGGDGSTQLFTVPDGVTELAVEMAGSKARNGGGSQQGGKGSTIRFSMVVIPGTVYAIDVGGHNTAAGTSHIGGWGASIGGDGAGGTGATGTGGGGSTGMRLDGAPFADSIAVAPAGGGNGGNASPHATPGGDSGFYAGLDGVVGGGFVRDFGDGATQFAPGPGGSDGTNTGETGDTDGPGYGGDADPATVGGGTTGSGGGGAGWHGGGGASGFYASGGGGAGYVDLAEVFDLEISDADNDADGYLEVSWADPL